MPSSLKAKEAILAAIPPSATTIYELGSGWGGLAHALSKNFPKAHIHAYEISPLPYLVSKLLYPKLNVRRKNFLHARLQDNSVIVCFLCPKGMAKLKTKFEHELKDFLIISNTFAVPGWQPIQIIPLKDLWKSQIFMYKNIRNS